MLPTHGSAAMPDRMSYACARFFAADWEASSFLEFFVDLQLRVSEDMAHGAGRTLARLGDHARFALQLTIVRSVDSYVAYLAEIEQVICRHRQSAAWPQDLTKELRMSVPLDVGTRYSAPMVHSNVRELDRLFATVTEIRLFLTPSDVDRIGRLVSLRNLITHGRTFAADDLATVVGETTSVSKLGIRLTNVRDDLQFLRASVARTDEAAAVKWSIERPVDRQQLFEAIQAASSADADPPRVVHQLDG